MATALSRVVALSGTTGVRTLKYNLKIAQALQFVDLEELQTLCMELSNLYWKFARLRDWCQRALRKNIDQLDLISVPAGWLRDFELLVSIYGNTMEDVRIIMRWPEQDSDPIVDPPDDKTIPYCPTVDQIDPIVRRIQDESIVMGFLLSASLEASSEDIEPFLSVIRLRVRRLVVDQLENSQAPVELYDRGLEDVPEGLHPLVLPPSELVQPADLAKPIESADREPYTRITRKKAKSRAQKDKAVRTSDPVQDIESIQNGQPVQGDQPVQRDQPVQECQPVQRIQPFQGSDPGSPNAFMPNALNDTLLSPSIDLQTFSSIDVPLTLPDTAPFSTDYSSPNGLQQSSFDDPLPFSVNDADVLPPSGFDALPSWSPDIRPPSPIDNLFHLPNASVASSLAISRLDNGPHELPNSSVSSSKAPMFHDIVHQVPNTSVASSFAIPQFDNEPHQLPNPSVASSSKALVLRGRLRQLWNTSVASSSTTPIPQSLSTTPFDVSTTGTTPMNLDILNTVVEATRPSVDMQRALNIAKSRTWNMKKLRQRRGIKNRWVRVYASKFMDGRACCGIRLIDRSWTINCPIIDSTFNLIEHPGGIWADAQFVVKDNTVSTYAPEYDVDGMEGLWHDWIWEEYTLKDAADAQSFAFCLIHMTAFVQQVRRVFVASTSHLHPEFPLYDPTALNLAAYLTSGRGGSAERVREWLKVLKIWV